MSVLVVYLVLWLAHIPLALLWWMTREVCSVHDHRLKCRCARDEQRERVARYGGEPLPWALPPLWRRCVRKPYGELHPRTSVEVGKAAGLALLYPLLPVVAFVVGAVALALLPVWLMGRLTPLTSGERRRVAGERERELAAVEERITARQAKIERLQREIQQ